MIRGKPRRCKYCKQPFIPRHPGFPCCSDECGIAYGMKQAAKTRKSAEREQRKLDRQQWLDAQQMQYWLKRAEKAVNAYVRKRDEDEPCISCGQWDAAEWHAGHFIPVGRAKSIRFDPANIHKQCDSCNVFGNGKATEYERRLIPKIGAEEVERLKTAPKTKKWTREECELIEADAKMKLKQLTEVK
jgi:hypothetical protein